MRLTLPETGKGKPWTLRVVREPVVDGDPVWGFCDFFRRDIVLSHDAKEHGIARETLIHELLHKLMPFLTEEAVDFTASELDLMLDFAESHDILDL